MDNTEKSELVIARLLTMIADNGLQGSEIGFDDLELEEDFQPYFDVSVRWLIDEGVIRVSELAELMGGTAILLNPVVTSYGYSCLNQRLLIKGKDMTVGGAVQEVSKQGTSYSGFGDFLGGLLGGFTKSMGSG